MEKSGQCHDLTYSVGLCEGAFGIHWMLRASHFTNKSKVSALKMKYLLTTELLAESLGPAR
jgi:hypothetical protein